MIYAYLFEEFNSIYIGLTINKERRDYQHSVVGSVFNFCQVFQVRKPQMKILWDKLTISEAKLKEIETINLYKEKGFSLLNKNKGGGLGCFSKIKTGNETNEFISKAKKIHGDRYDYTKTEYIANHTHVTITCPIHGDFQQLPSNHLQGHTCLRCSYENRKLKNTLSENKVINSFIKFHGDRYDYSKVKYVKDSVKVCIVCPEHGEFWQLPSHHKKGHGCPKCAIRKKK